MTKKASLAACPCGGAVYAQCCGRFHQGALPETAEQLMRSRYSAYALGLMTYLHGSWHASTRPPLSELTHDPAIKWLGLEVKRHQAEGDQAIVEFAARYKLGGRAHRLHETSRFVREDGRWFYVDGQVTEQ